MEGVIDKDQRLSEGRVDAEYGKLDFEESSDATEVELLLTFLREFCQQGKIPQKQRIRASATFEHWQT